MTLIRFREFTPRNCFKDDALANVIGTQDTRPISKVCYLSINVAILELSMLSVLGTMYNLSPNWHIYQRFV